MKIPKITKTYFVLTPLLLLSPFTWAAASASGAVESQVPSLLIESHTEDSSKGDSGYVADTTLSSPQSRAALDLSDKWWYSWDEIERTPLINEGHTCETLAAKPTLSLAQQDEIIGGGCQFVAFYDSFDREEGNGFKPLAVGHPVVGVPYGSLQKWNSYGGGIMLLKHNSLWVQAYSDNEGYVANLATMNGSSRIETKGGITLPKGHYKLLVKLKASTQKLLPKYVGVTTKIEGEAINIKQHDYVKSLYTNPYWDMIKIPFNVLYEDRVFISIEDIFNGMAHKGAIVDDIILYQVSEAPQS